MKRKDRILMVLACFNFIGLCLYFVPEAFYGGDKLYHELLLPIFLGYLLSYLFYMITIYLPEKERYIQIRPKIEQQQYYVYTSLFQLMDELFDQHFHEELLSGTLSEDDFSVALQNKCLNRTYLFDEYAKEYILIGDKLKAVSEKIEIEISRIYSFHDYLFGEEINILGDIRTKLFTYDLDRNAPVVVIDGKEFGLLCPNIEYMYRNYYEIYKLFLQLQKNVFTYKFENRDLVINKIQYYFCAKQYKQCQEVIINKMNEYEEDKDLMMSYYIRCLYEVNDKTGALERLEELFKNKLNILTWRSLFKDIINDKEVKILLEKYYSYKEVSSMQKLINEEKNIIQEFTMKNKRIKKYYEDKTEKQILK
ncbi:hypothetical protein [Clostridium estertheticum]|uniref:hypothetical protein n=1 Tax=Clostridium estertheticum TaxID=238834 RepID=UPI001C7CA666|nr:hypothetical protein [Clostridium estertheticum]MBX4266519.1 hypothetical protein [Clostridium estertheticum]WLC88140.1 hypothetical protein KTC95_19300 [Clostridium estertheticum]